MRQIKLLDTEGDSRVISINIQPPPADVQRWMQTWRSEPGARGQSEDWDWNQKLSTYSDIRDWQFVALTEGDKCHGMMIITWPQPARLETGRELVYVEYLEIAPANRSDSVAKRDLRGAGAALLEYAARASAALGFEGRIGLHSLSGAEGFYKRQRMHEFAPGIEDDELTYFELPSSGGAAR